MLKNDRQSPQAPREHDVATSNGDVATLRVVWWKNATLWAFIVSCGLAALYGRVALLNLNAGVVGGDLDGFENMWNDWWLRFSLFDLKRNPLFFTDYLYYPWGISLRYHTLNPLNGFFALPLWTLFGPVVSTNLKFVLSMALTCFCTYLLLKDLVGRALPALAGAALFTFANDQLIGFYSLGQAEKLSMWWFPLYFFFIFRLVSRPRWYLYFGLAVLTLLAMNLTDWQYVLYATLVTGGYGFFALFGKSRTWREKAILFAKLAGVGLVWAGLVIVPFLLPMLKEAAENPWLAVSEQSVYRARALSEFYEIGTGNPGYLALILTLVGLFLWARQSPARPERETVYFWAGAGFIAAVLTLGPRLIPVKLDLSKPVPPGAITNIPLPYEVLQHLPVLNIGRDPGRYYMITLLGAAVLFALALREILGWLQKRWQFIRAVPFGLASIGLVGLVLSVSLAGFMVEAGKAAVDPFDPPAFYSQLAKDSADYAILELPLFTEKGRGENTYQAYQLIHQKARFGGRYARDHKLTNPQNFSKRATLFRDFFWLYKTENIENYRVSKGRDILATPDYSEWGLPLLNYYKVRYIVLYKEALQELAWQALPAAEDLVKRTLGEAKPVFEDSKTRIYRVPDGPAPTKKLFVDVGSEGWYSAESNADLTYRWVDSCSNKEAEKNRAYNQCQNRAAELPAFNLSTERRKAQFSFTLLNYQAPRTVTAFINGYALQSFRLEAGASQEISLEVDIPAGYNSFTFSSTEPAVPVGTPQDARALSFGLANVKLTEK